MSQTDAPAVPAATILLLRESAEGLQVFMVVRHHQIDFASGALVFPGGKVDEQDFSTDLLAYLDGAHEDADMRAIQVSAIREAFEECGVLLARHNGTLIDGTHLAQLQDAREPLNNGSLPLLDFLRDNQLALACDLLIHFAHWITPHGMPKRFDTHFYIVAAPSDHLAVHDGYESVDSVWITPQQAVQEAQDGTRTIIFPTLRNLEKLAQFDSVEAVQAYCAGNPVVPVLPWTEQREDGHYVCIPTDAGYSICEEKIPDRPSK